MRQQLEILASGHRKSAMLHPAIAEHLTEDDDADLWAVATTGLLGLAQASAADTREPIYAHIGCCHHWISPHHPIRWVAGGGFTWPFGYDKTTTDWSYSALPGFTWFVSLKWVNGVWDLARTGRRCLVFRIAIPARTARYRQAAVHTIWTPRSPQGKEKPVQLFGFRKKRVRWALTASEVLRQRRRREL